MIWQRLKFMLNLFCFAEAKGKCLGSRAYVPNYVRCFRFNYIDNYLKTVSSHLNNYNNVPLFVSDSVPGTSLYPGLTWYNYV